jgi:hypothetical protein
VDASEIPSAVLELGIAVELGGVPVDAPETPANVELAAAELLDTDTTLAAVPVETPETPTRINELEEALDAAEVTTEVGAALKTLLDEEVGTITGAVPVDAPEIPSTVLWTELAAEELEATEDGTTATLD